ncbi:MAG TPA: tetratricopeptide repeat protein [Tepidisphaeraceae bacterium]|nr:tetratricopeptide repeat protein [Tepidisphaeraceae bacterium]
MSIQQAIELALGHHQSGRLAEAESIYRQVLAAQPNHPDALHLYGVLACQCGQMEVGLELLRRAIVTKPNDAYYISDLGHALLNAGKSRDAIAEFRRALQINPMLAGTWNTLGGAYLRLGDLDSAMENYVQALKLQPDFSLCRYNLSMAMFLKGDLEGAWSLAESRWEAKELGLTIQNFAQPRWDGSDLNGRRILLYAEQGFGDAIQFVRYVPMVQAQGGRVILAVAGELVRLMKQLPDVKQIVAHGDAMPAFDLQCPLLSLPGIFKTKLDTIPVRVPYLQAKNDHSRWRKRMGEVNKKKIGLVWAGRPEHRNDANRSLKFRQLAPILDDKFIFYSLQKGPASEQARTTNLIDWTNEIKDFADAAGLMENLDLIITVDTAAAHLAGAMGKVVWVLLPFLPDWRWMMKREDSPWYPTMRLFRQPTIGDWETPIRQITEELSRL